MEYEKVIGFAQVVEDGDIAVHRHRDVHLSCHYVGGRRRGGRRERHRDVRVGDCMVCMGGGGDIVGADCQEVLIVKNFKKTERESELKLQIIYACALMLVGVFVLVDVNVLVIALFALMLVEYFVRDRLGEFDSPISGGAEPPAEQPQGFAAEEPQAAPESEAATEDGAKPVRKVIAPKRRGDDAVPQEEPPTSEE